MKVEVLQLYISPGHNFYGRHGKGAEDHPIVAVEEVEAVAGKGLMGDRFFDYKPDYKGQITFFDAAVHETVKEKFNLPDLVPSAYRRNVIIAGVPLLELVGKTFELGGMRFEGTEEAKPCYWMDEACAPGVEEFLRGQGGLRAKILDDGVLGKGEMEVKVA